jgi:hypothetical protein
VWRIKCPPFSCVIMQCGSVIIRAAQHCKVPAFSSFRKLQSLTELLDDPAPQPADFSGERSVLTEST